MPSCEVCGEDEYTCHDGLYYCVHCRTQSQLIHELDQEEDFLQGAFSQGLSIKVPKKPTDDGGLQKKREKKKKQVDGGRPWTSDEGFQLILREQVKSLIKMGADPILKDVVFKFWSLYLSRLGMAFTDQERSKGLFTKKYPLTRDIYVPTADNPSVPTCKVRENKTKLKRGIINKKDKHVDKMVMGVMLGSEEFYEGDNPLDEEEGEDDDDDDMLVAICDDNCEEGYLISSGSDGSDDLLDTDSESGSSSNSGIGDGKPHSVSSEISLDESDGVAVRNMDREDGKQGSVSSSVPSEVSLDAESDSRTVGNMGATSSKSVSFSKRTRRRTSASSVASSSKSIPVFNRTTRSGCQVGKYTVGVESGAGSTVGVESGAESTVGVSSGAESTVGVRSGAGSTVGVESGAESTVASIGTESKSKQKEVINDTGAADTEKDIVKNVGEDQIVVKSDSKDGSGLSNDDDDDDKNKLKRKRKKQKETKLLAPTKRRISSTIVRTPWRLHMATTLAFCYIGLTFTNGNVVMSDIMRWVRNGALPFHNIMEIFPDDMKLSAKESLSFCSMAKGAVIPHHGRLRGAVGDLCRMLGITLPRPSLERLIGRYIIDMDLPGQLNALAVQLLKNSPVHDDVYKAGGDGIFPYEAMAMAYIVITLKMVFGLDDKRERELSSYSKEIKDILGDKAADCSIFVWEDWVINMEEKIISHRSRQMPLNYGDLKGIRDLDACLDQFNLNNPAKLGKFWNNATGPDDAKAAEALRKPLVALVDNLNQMKLSATESESSLEMDPMDLLLETPEKPDSQKTTDDTSQPKTTRLFFDCTIHHLTNPEAFLADIRSDNEDKDLMRRKKRRRLYCTTGNPAENITIEAENALEDLVESVSPAHKRYVLYEPGKMTSANRHISYVWLLNACTVFMECTTQDIDDCVNMIQYALPSFQGAIMTHSYRVTQWPRGLRPK